MKKDEVRVMRLHYSVNHPQPLLLFASPYPPRSLLIAVVYNILYDSGMNNNHKPIRFCGAALDDLRAFPEPARREAGHQLDRVQRNCAPDDWKPMPSIGAGVREIRIREATGAFRVVYVTRFEGVVCVLHCFQKKTQKTRREDIALATQRLKYLMKEQGS